MKPYDLNAPHFQNLEAPQHLDQGAMESCFSADRASRGIFLHPNITRKMEAIMSSRSVKLALAVCVFAAMSCFAQQSHWATAGDPTAKYITDSERQWAESGCTHNGIEPKILADDFQGTSAEDGSRYDKAHEVAQGADTKHSESDCRLLDAKVRFFATGGGTADDLAMVYGSETATRKGKDGKLAPHCQTWTDTWLKRNGKWQIIAAQDALFPCK